MNWSKEAREERFMERMARTLGFIRAKTVPERTPPTNLSEKNPLEGLEDEIDEVEEDVGETFVEYEPRKVDVGEKHPGDIVETGSLASVEPPDVTYVPAIQSMVERENTLSSLQMEAIIYACQRHEVRLRDGSRGGFFLGDGAGVGKGRTIAGLLMENWLLGRRKALWISASADLSFDARRDLDDINAKNIPIFELKKLPYGTIHVTEGVLFLTYSALISRNSNGHSRLSQIVQWLGKESDGLIIFDESHKAKNLVPDKQGKSEPTQTAVAVVTLQDTLRDSRVLYCSATGATEPRNMGYMVRLGLWGQRDSGFQNFQHFLTSVTEDKLSVLEMVAMEMKARGMYLSRSLSYKGADFDMVKVGLSEQMKRMYEESARIWHDLYDFLRSEDFLAFVEDKKVNKIFWASHQRFFRSMCIAAKVPAVVEEACKALRSGHCVVIGLQSTGEARMQDAVMKEGTCEFDNILSGPKEILKQTLEAVFGAAQLDIPRSRKRKQRSMDEGQRRKGMVCFRNSDDTAWVVQSSDSEDERDEMRETESDSELHHPAPYVGETLNHPSPHLLSAAENFIERVDSMHLPNNPLDDIIDRLSGPSFVAEMTGRQSIMVRSGVGAVVQARNKEAAVSSADLNLHERNLFQSGEKIVAIISEAASTGISLQADKRARNQLKRVHITLELPWSADRAMQQLGRTHRSNQTSCPRFRLLVTDLGGESRFAAAVARRLESMGALTQGDRRAGPVVSTLSSFNFQDKWGEKALGSFYNVILEKERPTVVPPRCLSLDDLVGINAFCSKVRCLLWGIGLFVKVSDHGIEAKFRENGREARQIPRFLNRLLGLAPGDQHLVFSYFLDVHKETVRVAKLSGQFDAGVSFLQSDLVTLLNPPQLLLSDKVSSCNALLYSFRVDRGLCWEKAVQKLAKHEEALAASRRLALSRRNQIIIDDEDEVDGTAVVPYQEQIVPVVEDTSRKQDSFGSGFYESKMSRGPKRMLLALENDNSESNSQLRTYQIFKPHLGLQSRNLYQFALQDQWVKVDSTSRGKRMWDAEYTRTENKCLHRMCTREHCFFGRRVIDVHIISGVVLQLWNIIKNQCQSPDQKAASKLNIVRFEYLDKSMGDVEGIRKSLIGIRVGPDIIPQLEQSIRTWTATIH